MSRPFIGVRWWLGAAFAVVAATSTAIVVSQFSSRSEQEFRGRAEKLAEANTFDAIGMIQTALRKDALRVQLPAIARRSSSAARIEVTSSIRPSTCVVLSEGSGDPNARSRTLI